MKIIDTHTHIGELEQWKCTADTLVASMNCAGIDNAIVSTLYGNEFDSKFNRIPQNQGQVQLNDDMLQQIKRYQGRLKALFAIRPYSESVDENLINYIKQNQEWFVGLKVHPRGGKSKFNISNYQSYLNLCEKLSIPFCIHSESDGFCNIEYIYEVAKNYSDINFIAVHMEFLSDHKKAIRYIKDCPNLYGDTTIVGIEDVVKAVKICGSNKILFGSDAAVFGEDSYKRYENYKERLISELGEDATADIFYKNAERIFKI